MSHPSVLAVNDLNFEEVVLKSKEPVLVDFGAVWCGPCKVLEPVVEKLAVENEGKFKVAKVDIDESPETAAKYGIRGVPTVIVFQGGERKGQHVGVANAAKLLALVPATLSRSPSGERLPANTTRSGAHASGLDVFVADRST